MKNLNLLISCFFFSRFLLFIFSEIFFDKLNLFIFFRSGLFILCLAWLGSRFISFHFWLNILELFQSENFRLFVFLCLFFGSLLGFQQLGLILFDFSFFLCDFLLFIQKIRNLKYKTLKNLFFLFFLQFF